MPKSCKHRLAEPKGVVSILKHWGRGELCLLKAHLRHLCPTITKISIGNFFYVLSEVAKKNGN